jgi:hypothetical protein
MVGGLTVVIQGQRLNNASSSRRSRERPSPPRQFKQQPRAIAAAASTAQATFTANQSIFTLGASCSIVSITALDAGVATQESGFVANLGRRNGSGDFLALRSNPQLKVTATD